MNICSIGRPLNGVTQLDFSSSRTTLDFDAVLIDFMGLVQANESIKPRAVGFRRSEFSEFLELGRSIVIFTAPINNLHEFLPISPVDVYALAGNRIDFKGPDHLKEFWQSVWQHMQFLGHFDRAPGQPFLFVSATSKPVGSLLRYGRGNLVFLPWLKAENLQTCQRFVTAFEKLNEHLAPKKQTVVSPPWSAHYAWERERKLRVNLASLQTQSDEISNQINTTTLELEAEDKLKILFTGKGDVLVDTVISVLNELQVKADPGEPGRDDIIVEFDGKRAVVEVKGKKGSAAESDAAQLEKWVAGFKEEHGTDPKGILIVNAYCETPLAERTEPAFPNQMLKYSTVREHCLITTTQLLGLLLEARAYPEKRPDLINTLFSTVGVYSEFADWRTFLIAPPAVAPAKTN